MPSNKNITYFKTNEINIPSKQYDGYDQVGEITKRKVNKVSKGK
jgi:hypothetical protein